MYVLSNIVKLYIDCATNKGQLMGTCGDILFVRNETKQVEKLNIADMGKTLFLYLRPLQDLTDEESKQLIKEGISIGRPHGYTFSGNGFLYLLSLNVDLFGLINEGWAKDLKAV